MVKTTGSEEGGNRKMSDATVKGEMETLATLRAV